MKTWIDVYSADGVTRLGNGAIYIVKSASVKRSLDGAGTFSASLSGVDTNAFSLIANKRQIIIYLEQRGNIRVLGGGVIEKISSTLTDNGWTLDISGNDQLSILKNKSVLLSKMYTQQSVTAIIQDLTNLANWTAQGDYIGNLLNVRLDGISVLKALQTVTQEQGIHFRLGDNPNTIEYGIFGDNANVFAFNPQHIHYEALANDDVAFIESIRLEKDSTDVVNYLLPLGSGEGEAAITLQYSTRTTPYTIQTTTGGDGKTLYYIRDTASISAYSQIEKVGTFKNIAPISNSDADLLAASNALYDASVAWLQRYKDVFEVYSLTLKKVTKNIKAGQKIHLRFKGAIERADGTFTYKDIDSDLWVLEISENIGADSVGCSLKVATVDRYEKDTASIIIGALENIELRNVKIQPYPSTRSYVYDRELAPSFSADIPIRFSNSTLTVQRVLVRIKTSPFRTTASSVASGGGATSSAGGAATSSAGGAATSSAGGDHSHRVAVGTFTNFSTSVSLWDGFNMRTSAGGSSSAILFPARGIGLGDLWTEGASGNHTHTVPNHTHTVPDHTHTVPNHTHTLAYGINDDSVTPTSIQVYIDGVNRTSPLGGAWAVGGGNTTIDLDAGLVTGYIVNAGGGLRQEHTLSVRCLGGQGRVEIQVEIYETIQSIAVS